MISYHILTYLTPQAFIEDDVVVLPVLQSSVFDEDYWQQSLFVAPFFKFSLWLEGNENPIFNNRPKKIADEDYWQRKIRTSNRRVYGRGGGIPPMPPKHLLHIDEETWQNRLFFNLKWRISLWFSSEK